MSRRAGYDYDNLFKDSTHFNKQKTTKISSPEKNSVSKIKFSKIKNWFGKRLSQQKNNK